jgi:Zn-dependent protease
VKAVRSARASASPMQLASTTGNILVSPQRSTIKFSQTEIRHLAVGTALVTLAGISFFLGSPGFGLVGLILSSVLFAMGFILHELAHKYVAQGYGLWAEFRVNMTGLLLTAISVVSPIKFIAPGAVMIAGFTDQNRMGRTAIAGPLVNVIITAALLIVLPTLETTIFYQAIVAGAAINAFLALFNLIPFSVFDGHKVYSWNRRYWAALLVVSLALTLYTNFVLHPFS